MIHTNLKKRYTPPQIEVTMSEIEDELLNASVTGTGGPQPGTVIGGGGGGFGTNPEESKMFGFDNFADYYDNDDYDDEEYYEF